MNVAIVLNYRAAGETISCVESILAHCLNIGHVVVIDNDSRDGSVEHISEWQKGNWKGRVTFLVGAKNNGYAGGNNYGLRWALENLQVDNFWIVNNDAYVAGDAFAPLLDALQCNKKLFVGSIILNARDGSVECYGGGRLYPLLGKAKLLGKGKRLEEMLCQGDVPDYLMGCSLAFPASLVRCIGLMDEDYFMYSEEVDWQYRARACGFSIKVVPESQVFHYGSLSSGGRSAFYHYYRNRAATRFNKRFYGAPFAFVSACFLSAITVVKEIKNPGLAWSGIKGAFKGVMMSVK
jgi:hypothetical protein